MSVPIYHVQVPCSDLPKRNHDDCIEFYAALFKKSCPEHIARFIVTNEKIILTKLSEY